MLKSIETRYKGYRFRSRLEARWAVFFDALGLDWKYEAQGFDVGGRAYLPDFELRDPSGNTIYIEVKGDPDSIASKRYECERYTSFVMSCRGELVLLGDIPSPGKGTAFHPIITVEGGLLYRKLAFFYGKAAPFGRAPSSALSILSGLQPIVGKDVCDPDIWVVDTKIISLPKYVHPVSEAYAKARAARFEHGESPL